MIVLTNQEKRILLFLVSLILTGISVSYFKSTARNVPANISTQQFSYINSAVKDSKTVNINKCDEESLKRLPGIGDRLAERIINYRNKAGSFKNAEELLKVKGIGVKKLERIKEYLIIEGGAGE